jgi:hypothetical protein
MKNMRIIALTFFALGALMIIAALLKDQEKTFEHPDWSTCFSIRL